MSSLSALDSLLSSSSSSSAIDLSAILQAATGSSSSGIDVTAAVNAAVTAAQAPETSWENQQTILQNQASALDQLQSYATSLDNDMQSLNSLTGPFSAASVSSSNSSIISGSAASGATASNNVVVVNSLATTASWTSTSVQDQSATLPSETFVITTASGNTATITTGNGINTLGQLQSAINGESLGVSASVITDANGSRLALTSDSSGSAGNFSATSSGSTFAFTQAEAGNNASLTVNGISIASASNTVTGAIPGITLSLQSANPNTEVTVNVTADTSQASTAVSQFVTDYNNLIKAVNSQYTDTGSGEGVLASDPTLQTLQSELLQSLDYTGAPASGAASTTVTGLSSLGVSVNSDGTLSLNTSTLNSALQNNYSDVQGCFQGSSLNGFANSLDQQLTSFLSPSDGAFTVDLQSLNSQNTELQDDITNFQTNIIDPLQTQLQAEFSKAEIALQQLPGEMKDVNAELGLNNNSSNG